MLENALNALIYLQNRTLPRLELDLSDKEKLPDLKLALLTLSWIVNSRENFPEALKKYLDQDGALTRNAVMHHVTVVLLEDLSGKIIYISEFVKKYISLFQAISDNQSIPENKEIYGHVSHATAVENENTLLLLNAYLIEVRAYLESNNNNNNNNNMNLEEQGNFIYNVIAIGEMLSKRTEKSIPENTQVIPLGAIFITNRHQAAHSVLIQTLPETCSNLSLSLSGSIKLNELETLIASFTVNKIFQTTQEVSNSSQRKSSSFFRNALVTQVEEKLTLYVYLVSLIFMQPKYHSIARLFPYQIILDKLKFLKKLPANKIKNFKKDTNVCMKQCQALIHAMYMMLHFVINDEDLNEELVQALQDKKRYILEKNVQYRHFFNLGTMLFNPALFKKTLLSAFKLLSKFQQLQHLLLMVRVAGDYIFHFGMELLSSETQFENNFELLLNEHQKLTSEDKKRLLRKLLLNNIPPQLCLKAMDLFDLQFKLNEIAITAETQKTDLLNLVSMHAIRTSCDELFFSFCERIIFENGRNNNLNLVPDEQHILFLSALYKVEFSNVNSDTQVKEIHGLVYTAKYFKKITSLFCEQINLQTPEKKSCFGMLANSISKPTEAEPYNEQVKKIKHLVKMKAFDLVNDVQFMVQRENLRGGARYKGKIFSVPNFYYLVNVRLEGNEKVIAFYLNAVKSRGMRYYKSFIESLSTVEAFNGFFAFAYTVGLVQQPLPVEKNNTINGGALEFIETTFENILQIWTTIFLKNILKRLLEEYKAIQLIERKTEKLNTLSRILPTLEAERKTPLREQIEKQHTELTDERDALMAKRFSIEGGQADYLKAIQPPVNRNNNN